MSQYREIVKSVLTEAKAGMHPMGVHAHPIGKGQYKVHAVGSKVNPEHVKAGDTIRSSDMDDLSDAGHKVKEVKKPVNEDMSTAGTLSSTPSFEEGKIMGSGGYRMKDGTYVPFKSFEKAGQEVRAKQTAADRALADADKKTRDRAK